MAVKINLLPKREQSSIARRIFWITVVLLMAVLLIWARLQFLASERQLALRTEYEQHLQAEMTRLESQLAAYHDGVVCLEYAHLVERLEGMPQQVVPLLQKITALLPAEGRITRLQYEREGQFMLTLKSRSLPQLAAFLFHGEQDLGVEGLSLQQIRAERQDSGFTQYVGEFRLKMAASPSGGKGGEEHE